MESNGYSDGEALLEPLTHINREHLAAMADAAVTDHHHDYATSTPSSPNQKRKRSGPESSPDSRRSKRAQMTPISTPDPASAAYVESAVEAAQAAAQAATADFAALQQATVERHEVSDPANASSTAAAALGTMYPTLHVPQTTEATFVAPTSTDNEGHHGSPYNHHEMLQSHSLSDSSANEMAQQGHTNGTPQGQTYPSRPSNPPTKLAVGSEEWHKQRKDNHKEVERRRRETINEGINELAKIVPGCEKNKGSILQRAVLYITQLRENEAQNIEKWTLEKLLTEQAIQELSTSNDKLKSECERAYRELTIWKNLATSAGLEPPQTKTEP